MVPNSVEVLVCYPPRLVIDAFAQPYRHPRLNQTDDVLEAAPEAGLYHGAGVLVALVHVQSYPDGRGLKGESSISTRTKRFLSAAYSMISSRFARHSSSSKSSPSPVSLTEMPDLSSCSLRASRTTL